MNKRIPVGILGATGMVGQQYMQLLQNHPWFEVTFVASSEQSAGKTYGEAVSGRWYMQSAIPSCYESIPVHHVGDIAAAKKSCAFVFSAMSNEGAKLYEESYAKHGFPVISNASYHRHDFDVPVLIPEVNHDHIDIIPLQQANRKWDRGYIVVKPNCSLQSYVIPLAPLHNCFKVKKLSITTLQAVSGAGYPGVSSLNIIDNIIPYIAGEEEKSEQEPLKIWGKIQNGKIISADDIAISVQCTRVPVLDGHLACISVEFESKPKEHEILELWHKFQALPQQLKLPSAPTTPIIYQSQNDRPQPRLDRNAGNGMSVTAGRLRECPLLHYRFVALSHNTIRGAAGGGILNAELLLKQGYINR